MFQYTDSGRVKGISTNVDINEMDCSFFKEVTTNLSMTNNTKGPFVYSKGDRGLGVKQIQQNLIALGFSLPKFGADGFYGDELIAAMKKFQNRYDLFSDGIAGADTLPILVKEVNNLNNLV
jgi:peptidoglycan hydrolase-like protein with peptidoglycan-binding domain